jgi:hypothetical protein
MHVVSVLEEWAILVLDLFGVWEAQCKEWVAHIQLSRRWIWGLWFSGLWRLVDLKVLWKFLEECIPLIFEDGRRNETDVRSRQYL